MNIDNDNVSEKFVLDAIREQLEKNDKTSFQFNKFLYTEVKGDTLEMARKMKEVHDYDNGRAR